MLKKIFDNKRANNLSLNPVRARAPENPSGPLERESRALKIIHPGGHAEYHYMATPAQRIIEKYPSFILTRPEIFRRPWESVVLPDEILVLGQTYYIVPRKTVKKLRRRIKKTSALDHRSSFSFQSKSLVENASQQQDTLSISSILVQPGQKVNARIHHVRFLGAESTNQKSGSDQVSVPSNKKIGFKIEKRSERLRILDMNEKERGAQNENAWEASLNSIIE